MRFRVQLDAFAGPLDLLLYLVRRHELDVLNIPIAQVADQYAEILEVLQEIDFEAVGEFLDWATRLMEIKTQLLLPHQEEEEVEVEDPRQDLVERLLDYKRYKDAAVVLDERRRDWQQRFPRRVNDLEEGPVNPADQPIQEVELWDLVSAFSRVIREKVAAQPAKIRYDDTPIEVYMERIKDRLQREPRIRFVDLFEAGAHRSQMIGVFLAVLELIRHAHAAAEQDKNFGELWVCQRTDSDEASEAPASVAIGSPASAAGDGD